MLGLKARMIVGKTARLWSNLLSKPHQPKTVTFGTSSHLNLTDTVAQCVYDIDITFMMKSARLD